MLPEVGEHTREVLRELGIDDELSDRLLGAGLANQVEG